MNGQLTQNQQDIRYILNAHVGATNYINLNDIKKLIKITLNPIKRILYDISGPTPSHSLIIYDKGGKSLSFLINVFTTDGKHTIESLDFISPIQRYLAALICYIGQRVNEEAYDGTSSAMILASDFLLKFYNDLSESTSPQYLNYCKKALEIILTKVLNSIKNTVINPSDIREEDLRTLLKTTTKNHEELTELLVYISKYLPDVLLDYFFYEKSKVETDKNFELIYPEWDYVLIISNYDKRFNNDTFKTKFIADEATLIIYDDIIDFANQEHIYRLQKILEYLTEDNIKKPVILLYLDTTSHYELVQLLNTRYSYFPVISCKYFAFEPTLQSSNLELTALRLVSYLDQPLSQIPSSQITKDNYKHFIKTNVKVEIFNNQLKLKNLYKPLEDQFVHPRYINLDDPSNAPYKKFIEDLQHQIKELKNHVVSQDLTDTINSYIKVLRNTIAFKMPYIRIGGKAIDQLANIDLLEDAKGVLMVAKKHGIIYNGYRVFYDTITFFHDEYLTIFEKEIKEKGIPEDVFKFILNIWKEVLEEYLAYFGKSFETCQNAKTITTMIERFIEILPKFIGTSYIIVPGTTRLDTESESSNTK